MRETEVTSVTDIPDDHLEFLERMVFYEFDEAYRQYHQDDLPTLHKVRAYEQALETISAIRTLRDEIGEEQLRRTAAVTRTAIDDEQSNNI